MSGASPQPLFTVIMLLRRVFVVFVSSGRRKTSPLVAMISNSGGGGGGGGGQNPLAPPPAPCIRPYGQCSTEKLGIARERVASSHYPAWENIP